MTLEEAVELANQEFSYDDEGGKPRGRGRPKMQAPGGLTDREYEIAALVAQGMTNRQIARRLVLSVRTIEMHVANAMQKPGVHTRTELAAWTMGQDPGYESARS